MKKLICFALLTLIMLPTAIAVDISSMTDEELIA